MKKYRIVPLPSVKGDSVPPPPDAPPKDEGVPLGFDAPYMVSPEAEQERAAEKRKKRSTALRLRRQHRIRTRQRQLDRLSPSFQDLNNLLLNPSNRRIARSREDDKSILPDRAVVFESLPSSSGFRKSLHQIEDLEWMVEERPVLRESMKPNLLVRAPMGSASAPSLLRIDDSPIAPASRTRRIPSRVRSIAIPALTSLRQLHESWIEWNQYLDKFGMESDDTQNILDKAYIRSWQPRDRIPKHLIHHLLSNCFSNDPNLVQLKVELWFRRDPRSRDLAFRSFEDVLHEIDGSIIARDTLSNIRYDFAVIEFPRQVLEVPTHKGYLRFQRCDSIRYLRPPQVAEFTDSYDEAPNVARHSMPNEEHKEYESNSSPKIAALFDGFPDQSHAKLHGRINELDPEGHRHNHRARALSHGTAMASIMLHGDLSCTPQVATSPIVACPVPMQLASDGEASHIRWHDLESSIQDYVEWMRIGQNGSAPFAPDAFLVNVSLGSQYADRSFEGGRGPLATQLDMLSYEHNVLFVVSAGNYDKCPFSISGYSMVPKFLKDDDRYYWPDESAILKSLLDKAEIRKITPPAQARNVLTVGSQYKEWQAGSWRGDNAVGPYHSGDGFPNVYSGLGLGLSEAVKPDILVPAGRHPVNVIPGARSVGIKPLLGRVAGLLAAQPGADGTDITFSGGTSSATALSTYFAQRLHGKLGSDGVDLDSEPSWLDPTYHAVAVKSLLVHSARWDRGDGALHVVKPQRRSSLSRRRLMELTKILGYGMPEFDELLAGKPSRATFLNCASLLGPKSKESFEVPAPNCIKNNHMRLTVAITLAWFTPVDVERVDAWSRLFAILTPGDAALSPPSPMRFQPPKALAQNGTVFHQWYTIKATGNTQLGTLLYITVGRRSRDGFADIPIPFAVAATVEGPDGIDLYDDADVQLRNLQPSSAAEDV